MPRLHNYVRSVLIRAVLLVAIAIFAIIAVPLYAATKGDAVITLEPTVSKSPIGAPVGLVVRVKSELPLNAYRVSIIYPADALQFVRFDTKDSVIDLWYSEPNGETPGFIEIIGGSSRPFIEKEGVLGTIMFRTLKSGQVAFSLSRPEIYVADGLGSRTEVSSPPATLTITEEVLTVPSGEKTDTAPPAIMQIAITDDPFNAKQKIVGITSHDLESGVRTIFAREKSGLSWSQWFPVNRSFAIHQNAWAIAIKTIDNFGNETQRVVYDWSILFQNVFLPILLFAGVASLVLFGLRTRRRGR